MRIVEIIPTLNSGGAERFTVDLSNELSRNNDVTLIVLDSLEKSGFYASEISSRVKVISLRRKRRIDFSILFSLRNIIHKIKPDIVHTHIRAIIFTLWTILTTRNIKYFHTIHSDAKPEAKNWLWGLVRLYLFKNRIVTPVTISPHSLKSFTEYYKMNAPMIINGRNIPQKNVISQKVKDEFSAYKTDSKTKVLLCLARFSDIKRQNILAKIAYRLLGENYNFSLLFIGNNNDHKILEGVKSHNCKNIFILGERTNPLEYLMMSDAFCLCSRHEGMPISLIEALGVGTIPICTPVGGIKDVIENGKNGLLSSDLSEDSYYNTLKSFLRLSDSDICKMKKEALNSYHLYDMKECANNYFLLFSQSLFI